MAKPGTTRLDERQTTRQATRETERQSGVTRHVTERTVAPARVMIERVEPEVDGGRFPAKRALGDIVVVGADVFTEGHDLVSAALRFRHDSDERWSEIPMRATRPGTDRFEASFRVQQLGFYEFTLDAWVASFATWRRGLAKKVDAGVNVESELLEGAALLTAAAKNAPPEDCAWLQDRAARIAGTENAEQRADVALDAALAERMARLEERVGAARYGIAPRILVERQRAAFGAWYEFFPRSASSEPGRHGTFRDAEERLAYAASMGFDVVYLPPIHPIGVTHRKGPNNSPVASPGDAGSPWAIGAAEGGFIAIHPDLGSEADFARLVERARALDLELALDLAFQCSPDHPWVKEHPEWFRWRPDGTVQYAENPPKKYQDVLPLHFEGEAWRSLWDALLEVTLFWVDRGVRIFRVDNPHTKPFPFWEWLIAEVRAKHPDVIFLAEAFTRPSVMKYLAKCGFSQSYTYFTWRNTKAELTAYMEDLTRGDAREYLRPNFFANTPDILPEYLQTGGRPAFQIRLVLAAMLAGNYGIYGPPFELCVADAVPGSEEYLDSEKYEIRSWDLEAPHSLRPWITRVNEIRKENPALRHAERLTVVPTDDDAIFAFVRSTPDLENVLLVVVNLDPYHARAGWLDLDLAALKIDATQSFQMQDLLGGGRFLWQGPRSYVALDPNVLPAHILRLRRRVRTEQDFDYFL